MFLPLHRLLGTRIASVHSWSHTSYVLEDTHEIGGVGISQGIGDVAYHTVSCDKKKLSLFYAFACDIEHWCHAHMMGEDAYEVFWRKACF